MDTNTITAVSSTVIALAALLFAVYEGRAVRKHNRLSLMPHLTCVAEFSDKNPRYSAMIENTGVGPAIVCSFDVWIAGEKYEDFEAGAWLAILDLLGLKGRAKGLVIDIGEFIPAGKILPFLQIESEKLSQPIKEIRQVVQKIKVRIVYQSAYGDQKELIIEQPSSIFDCYETGNKDL